MTEPVNPADAENPGNTFTTLGTNPENEIATEATVNIPAVEKIAEDDDAAVSTESTIMDMTATETISSENIAEESVGEKSDVIVDGSGIGDGTKLVDLVTGTNLVSTTNDNLVSTTLNPPQEQPVTFFPSEEEEEEVTTDNVIVDSDGLASEGLVIASNEIADESVEAESVTELVTSSETKKSSRRDGGRAQSVDSQNVIKFVDVKGDSNTDETTVKPEENLPNSRIIFPDDADDEQSFEVTLSTVQPGTEATTSGAVVI